MCCAKDAEFALFAVFFWSSLDSLLDCWNSLLWIQQISRNSWGAVGELREIWLIRSNFLEFSVDGSENSELDVDEF